MMNDKQNEFNIDEAAIVSDALGDDVSDGVVAFAVQEFGKPETTTLYYPEGVSTIQDSGTPLNLTEIAEKFEDPWNEYPEVLPDVSGLGMFEGKKLIVESNRGVDVATYHQKMNGSWCFQTSGGDDEGMIGYGTEPYKVYRWMELPKGKCSE